MDLREAINKRPWIGYLLVAVCVGGGVFLYMRLSGSGSLDSVERLSQKITIRDIETGDEWTITRGNMELTLIAQSAKGALDSKAGLPNPKTGKPNGFPIDSTWSDTINRINAERAAQRQAGPVSGSPTAGGPPANPPVKGK